MLLFLSVFLLQFIFAQRNITGTVTSLPDNTPLPGVNIVEKGTMNGTTSDADGKYSLSVSDGAKLVFHSLDIEPRK